MRRVLDSREEDFMMSCLLVLDKEREQLRHRMCPYFAQSVIVEALVEAYHIADVRLAD